MTNWTTVPPWLYQNDLPDDQLQAVYVAHAEQKWRELRERREALEDEVEQARQAERRAAAFLAEAKERLAAYRQQAAPPRARVVRSRRLLPGR